TDLRIAAVAAVGPRGGTIAPAVFDFLLTRLEPNLAPLDRLAAAAAVGQAPLDDAQLTRLTKAIATAGALEMPPIVGPFEKSKDPQVGRQLLAGLDKAPGFSSLTPDGVRRTFQGFPEAVRQDAEKLVARLEVDAEKMRARLLDLAPALLGG